MENSDVSNQSNLNARTKVPFYQSTWFVILMMCCCCFPLGLFLMWKYKKFNKNVRIIITAFFILGTLGRIGAYGNSLEYASEKEATVEETTVPEASIAALSETNIEEIISSIS